MKDKERQAVLSCSPDALRLEESSLPSIQYFIAILDGEAHAEFFMHLANGDSDVPWLATFVEDKVHIKF